MNAARREQLKIAAGYLRKAYSIVDKALDDELDALYNMPENLEGSDQCQKMESATDSMESALESIDTATEDVLSAAS